MNSINYLYNNTFGDKINLYFGLKCQTFSKEKQ